MMPALKTIGSVTMPTTSRPRPRALTAGQMLLPGVGCAAGDVVVLDVVLGPRDDWFTPEWRATLTGQDFSVSADSDRVGVRTTAETPLARSVARELPSEGVETGSLQVPPEGFPVLFLADHPMTGGYPVIGVVARDDVRLAAQLRPGQRIRFV